MQQLQQLQQPNINTFIPNQQPSKFNIILDEINKNIKLFTIILLSYILLQNPQVKNLITSRLSNINVPYINTIALAITQVLIVLSSKIFL